MMTPRQYRVWRKHLRLGSLMYQYYLSTACASGRCEDCRLLNKYTGRSCVCWLCHHVPPTRGPADCGPWLMVGGGDELLPWRVGNDHTYKELRRADYEFDEDNRIGLRTTLIDAVLEEWAAMGLTDDDGGDLARHTARTAVLAVVLKMSPNLVRRT